MEVHHPHHPTHKKKWSEYFLEFLMIFLAVTMGFIAENIREERVNHVKEKEYMKSMLQDLVSDTSMLNEDIIFTADIGKGLDSLSNLLYKSNGSDSSTLNIYRLQAAYTRVLGSNFNDLTSIQLHNSGGMQVIKKTEVRTAIADYWKRITTIDQITDRLNDASDGDFAYTIFNRSYQHFNLDNSSGKSIVSIDRGAHFMTNDKNQLINYANRMKRKVSIINVFFIPNLKNQKKAAIDLMSLIKKEYRLD